MLSKKFSCDNQRMKDSAEVAASCKKNQKKNTLKNVSLVGIFVVKPFMATSSLVGVQSTSAA